MKKLRVLVTGAGSGVGQGIMKSLKKSVLDIHLIGADIHPLNAGLFAVNEAVIIPKVESPGSLQLLSEILIRMKVDVLMVGSEYELLYFAEHRKFLEQNTGARIAVSCLESIRVSDDKLLTAELLKSNKLPFPKSVAGDDPNVYVPFAKECGYPVLVKPRSGTSARGVHILKNESELLSCLKDKQNYMVQELLDSTERNQPNEYTCSIFRCQDGSVRGPFVSRRTLKGGHSWVVEVRPITELAELMFRISDCYRFSGSLNVQFMKNASTFIPIEFNCRFSGTTAVRAHFGFNEPEMYLLNYILGEELPSDYVITEGLAFRYPEEIFVDGHSVDSVVNGIPLGTKENWF